MPFKSKAQIKKFYELHKEGKISSQTIAEWSRGTNLKTLPVHVKPKKRSILTNGNRTKGTK